RSDRGDGLAGKPNSPMKRGLYPGWRDGGGRLEQPLDVTRHEIDLDVDAVSGRHLLEIGGRERMRNQVDHKLGAAHLVYRKTHAIHRDRALAGGVAGELARQLDRQLPVITQRYDARHDAGSVHVAAHEMATEAVRETQRLLQVDERAGGKTYGAGQ